MSINTCLQCSWTWPLSRGKKGKGSWCIVNLLIWPVLISLLVSISVERHETLPFAGLSTWIEEVLCCQPCQFWCWKRGGKFSVKFADFFSVEFLLGVVIRFFISFHNHRNIYMLDLHIQVYIPPQPHRYQFTKPPCLSVWKSSEHWYSICWKIWELLKPFLTNF